MRSVFSTTDVARFCVAGAALLFALSALLGSLPDPNTLGEQIESDALAGYEKVSITTPYRQPVLEEYYDHLPSSGTTSITARAPQIQ